MPNKNIACAYYSTTIFIVDDDINFAENMKLVLPEFYQIKLEHDPNSAKDLLLATSEKLPDWHACFSTNATDEDEGLSTLQQSLTIDLSKFRNVINEPNHIDEVSVLVVDYAMPGMSGIELCEALRKTVMKKVLITAMVDKEIAIKAFNQGVIDCFIIKQNPKFFDDLNSAIIKLQYEYFQTRSKVMLSILEKKPSWCLSNSKVLDKLNELFITYKVVNYAMIESSGSVIAKTKDGQEFLVLLINKTSLDEYLQMAIQNYAPSHIVDALQQYKAVPNLASVESYFVPIEDWHKILVPTQQIDDEYFYAVVFTNNNEINNYSHE